MPIGVAVMIGKIFLARRLESADRFARPSEIVQLQAAQDATREFGRSKCPEA
jgi:hypothetical protein